MSCKDADEYRNYMRAYMRKVRANENHFQREKRLQWNRDYSKRKYDEGLARLGLERVGTGHRRDWAF